MIGQLVGARYEVVHLLGEGGMGAVYEARDRSVDRSVAIKVISDEEVAQDEVLVARFQREARAAAKVRSPHIVEILDAGHDAERRTPYMVMELLRGESVLDVLNRLGPLPPELALRIAIQTCTGLEHAHAVGVVHRDIKPANLFLAEGHTDAEDELTVKLLDFGVAKFKMDKASETDKQSLTRTGSMLGSPIYMSPEQARGLKSIDHRADIWSLGIVLHQLLTGRQPHQGIDGLGELIITICSDPPEPITARAPWCSPELARVVSGALQLAADKRYPSAKIMREALARCLPDGGADTRILKSMLVPLSEEQRAVAPVRDDATVALSESQVQVVTEVQQRDSESDVATVALEPERVRRAVRYPQPPPPDPAELERQRRAQLQAMDAARLTNKPPRPNPTTMALVAGLVLGAVALFAYLAWRAFG
jgi:serine/threonine-protein kinase